MRFTEWTADGKLRHPVYLGLRDDKSAKEVVKEGPGPRIGAAPSRRQAPANDGLEAVLDQLQALEDARRTASSRCPTAIA